MSAVDRRLMLDSLREASIRLRIYADRENGLDAQRLEALADSLDAERRVQGDKVPERRREPDAFAEV